jgi:hypothetical protein
LVRAAVLDLTEGARTRDEAVRVSAQNDVVILVGRVGIVPGEARPSRTCGAVMMAANTAGNAVQSITRPSVVPGPQKW